MLDERRESDMPARLGATELIIILSIVIVLFGVGRLSKVGSELGQAIRAFRKEVSEAPENS
jgi:sec-independent protein translocase protein TatA